MRPDSLPRFLICGKRTGSTMLSRILDSHSQIACPMEFAIPALLGRQHWKYVAARKKAAVIAEHYKFPTSAVDDIRVLPGRITLPLIKRRLNKVFQTICSIEQKQLLVIKEPAHHEVVDKIVHMYGQESLLLLARGPLATATSLAKSFDDKQPLRTWAEAHRNILRWAQQGATLVRYEDLIADAATEIRRVCDSLNVPFEANMLDFGQHEHTDDKLGLWYRDTTGQELVPAKESQLHQTVTKGYIDTQHNEQRLKETPTAIVEEYARDEFGSRSLAKELGYDELAIMTEKSEVVVTASS